jgi:hypothetical protein
VPRLFNHRNYASPWTNEDFELLAASVKDGRPIAEIAKSMGRSQEAVRCKAWQGGLLPPRKKKQ